MPLRPWSAELSVNVAQLDDQHKNLIDMVNRLHEAMFKGVYRPLEMVEFLSNWLTDPVLKADRQYAAARSTVGPP